MKSARDHEMDNHVELAEAYGNSLTDEAHRIDTPSLKFARIWLYRTKEKWMDDLDSE